MTGLSNDVVSQLLTDWNRERPDLDVEAMGVVGRIIHLSAICQISANRALRPFGLRYTDFDVLATIRRRGAPYKVTPKELRYSVLITSGAMTACLDRLEKRGSIKRSPDPSDRRGTLIRLTASGRRLIDKAVETRFENASDALTALNKKELMSLQRLLSKLAESMSEHLD